MHWSDQRTRGGFAPTRAPVGPQQPLPRAPCGVSGWSLASLLWWLLSRCLGWSPAQRPSCVETQIVLWNLSHFTLPAHAFVVLARQNGSSSRAQFESPHRAGGTNLRLESRFTVVISQNLLHELVPVKSTSNLLHNLKYKTRPPHFDDSRAWRRPPRPLPWFVLRPCSAHASPASPLPQHTSPPPLLPSPSVALQLSRFLRDEAGVPYRVRSRPLEGRSAIWQKKAMSPPTLPNSTVKDIENSSAGGPLSRLR